jgi:membrane-associated phospholipid phosphatase
VPRRPLLIALLCAAVGAVVWLLAVHTAWGARVDSEGLIGFTDLATPRVKSLADFVADLVDPLPFALAGVALACIPLARGRPRHALVVLLVLVGANVTTQVLKLLLAAPRPDAVSPGLVGVDDAAWPSGHTTAALTLALCLVLVAPARLRPLAAAVGGLFVIAVVYSLMLLGWHYPSDILGGFCVAVGWAAVGIAVLRATGDRARVGALRLHAVLTPAAVAALALATLATLVLLVRPGGVYDYVQDHTTFAAAAVGIGTAALALSAGAAAALRRAH